MRALRGLTWAVPVLLLLGGCDPYADYCTARGDCNGGNELDLEACKVDKESEEEHADLFGCCDEFDEAETCIQDNATCDDNSNNYGLEGDECEDELNALSNCLSD